LTEGRRALEYLLACPYRRRQLHDRRRFDAAAVISRALAIRERVRTLGDERDFLRRRIQDLEPWGDFTFPPRKDLAGYRLWFYIVPHYQMPKVAATDLIWQVVHRDNRFCYVVVISEGMPEGMPVPRTRTGARPKSELERRLEDVEVEIEDLEAERASLTRWCDLLAGSLHRLEDEAALESATHQTRDEEPVFALQGWAPRERLEELQRFVDERPLALVATEPTADDEPPTLFDNPPVVAGGEDLVRFYMTPHYRLWDPSIVVFFSFVVFFAMILSDAGYALILGLILAWAWKRMGRSTTGRRLRVLGGALVASSAVWGVLAGSYFGVAPVAESLPGRLKLFDLSDSSTMMRLTILIGVAHVALANLAMARRHWRDGLRPAALAPLGWVTALLGAVALGFGVDDSALKAAGPWIMGAGGAAILLFTGFAEAPAGSSFLKRLLPGLRGLSRITSAFGDVLSYLRLFALGLASASLAVAFNGLAGQVAEGVPGLGTLLALLVLLLGHALNFTLAVVSGVVHGMRLNCIEFFGWSVPEEGRPFRAFAKKESASWNR
jgi:V/A-type H+-transporting ATPase subunit I